MKMTPKQQNDHDTVREAIFAQLKGKARKCPSCGKLAIVPLTAFERTEQPDQTTHVCHPAIGGCNGGFEDMNT